MVGLTRRVSLRETPVEDLADASKTALIFVVVLDSLYAACIGGLKFSSGGYQIWHGDGLSMLQIEILLHDFVEFLEATLLVQRTLQRETPLHSL